MFVAKEEFQYPVQRGSVDCFDYNRAASGVVLKSERGGPDVKKAGNVPARVVATNAAAAENGEGRHRDGLGELPDAPPPAAP